MKSFWGWMTGVILLALPPFAYAQDGWPYTLRTPQGVIEIYQPQPQKLTGNKLTAIAAVACTPPGKDPVYGAVWIDATIETDRGTRAVMLESVSVPDARFPATADTQQVASLRALLERELPKHAFGMDMDQLLTELDQTTDAAAGLKNDPPRIIFRETPSLLVLIDGPPKTQKDARLGLQRVVNTPYTILEDAGRYYLYIAGRWYSATSAAGDYTYNARPPSGIQKAQRQLESGQQVTRIALDSLPAIVVSTEPAELIQSRGGPAFAPIQGTGLLYLSNSPDNIFMNIADQSYYLLISGRWYKARGLQGPWSYIEPGSLPPDFARIPEGSAKDAVLASVPGTKAAHDAVMDAQVPQTAKVDRRKATTSVQYNGTPEFSAIAGTNLSYAVNTTATVLKQGNLYYVVDKGVWFTGHSPNGPWAVADSRPAEVDKIPASSPVYNTRYVYIYDTTPEYVYMGYTPGYLGCYVAGPTVVYGTGYVYPGWYGPMYYPRPVTWGFGMSYNPWTGWSFGIGMSVGPFHFGIGWNAGGGWWGPPVYRPPFAYPYPHVYGPRPVVVNNFNNINIHNNFIHDNNIYNHRNDVVTHDKIADRRISGQTRHEPGGRISGQTQHFPGAQNNIGGGGVRRDQMAADRNGNVYRQRPGGGIERNGGQQWHPVDRSHAGGQPARTFENRQRGFDRSSGFSNMRGFGGGHPAGGRSFRPRR